MMDIYVHVAMQNSPFIHVMILLLKWLIFIVFIAFYEYCSRGFFYKILKKLSCESKKSGIFVLIFVLIKLLFCSTLLVFSSPTTRTSNFVDLKLFNRANTELPTEAINAAQCNFFSPLRLTVPCKICKPQSQNHLHCQHDFFFVSKLVLMIVSWNTALVSSYFFHNLYGNVQPLIIAMFSQARSLSRKRLKRVVWLWIIFILYYYAFHARFIQ